MKDLHPFNKLSGSFYTRDVLVVAKELLGKVLVKKNYKTFLAGKIVEVEAYNGAIDEAAHTFNGKTERNKIMFDEGGYLYVYFTYGTHFCCNVVTGKKDEGTAVLIRAVEPLEGIWKMSLNRFGKEIFLERERINLTNGPGKVCQALGITKEHYGTDLRGDQVFIIDRPKINSRQIVATRRVGIKKSVGLTWRFYIKDNLYVSKK